jgi:serine protease
MTSRGLFQPSWLGGVALVLGLLAAPLTQAAPGELKARVPASKAQSPLPAGTIVDRLVVKFHEGTRVRLREGQLAVLAQERGPEERALLARRGLVDARLEADLVAARALMARVPGRAAPGRLFQEDERVLAEHKRTGEERGGQQLADLSLYFEVPLLPGTSQEQVAEVVARLNALDSVEVAFAEPTAEPAAVNLGMDAAVRSLLAAADIPPTTPQYEGQQGYLDAAPGGIDARYAWTVVGGAGSGVKVVDIERAWNITHEDLPTLFYQGGAQLPSIASRNHGTAVLGELVGALNTYGVTGIVHQAQAGYSSYIDQSTASAISSAGSAVGPGGVILIEIHAPGPEDSTPCTCNLSQCNYIPVEYWQDNYDAIATAIANGVTVVEAAGNGSVNLDDSVYNNAFNPASRDSGAILVGASESTSRTPTCWTNFGSRVDLHGWGDNVMTLGYEDWLYSGENQYYTSSFSGTSSASPIVAGAAVSLQGIALASGRGVLAPQKLRRILKETGTPQTVSNQNIGPMPNLRQAISQLNGLGLVCDGQTTPGATAWVYNGTDSLYLDVDTRDCGFVSTPLYFTSLGGWAHHWTAPGATAIYSPTHTGFRVYIRAPGVSPALANQYGWHLNWQAVPKNLQQNSLCTGQTAQGASAWQQYGSDGIYLDVNTVACAQAVPPLYLTSLGGWANHRLASGATSIYNATATGFRVYIYLPGITPALANQYGWNINWQALPNFSYQLSQCTEQTAQGSTAWQQYGSDGIYVDVSTPYCPLSTTPRFITSLGGWANHWSVSGATSIYSPTHTGFRVYVYAPGMTPALANQYGWRINWVVR